MTGVRTVLASGVFASGDETNPLIPAWGEVIIGTIAFGAAVLGADPRRRFRASSRSTRSVTTRSRAASSGPRRPRPRRSARSSSTARSWPRHVPRPAASARRLARRPSRSARSCQARGPARHAGAGRGAGGSVGRAHRSSSAQLRGEVGELAVELASRIVGSRARVQRRVSARSSTTSSPASRPVRRASRARPTLAAGS